MQLETYISVASAIAALLSALYALKSAHLAEKALKIAQIDHRERHDGLQVNLIDSIQWLNNESECFVAFACNLINQSTSPNSIARIELHVTEFSDNGLASKSKLSPITNQNIIGLSRNLFPTELNLNPRSTVSGWLAFKIPEHFAHRKRIDKYEVIFTDTSDQRVSFEQYFTKTVQDPKDEK